MDRVDALKGRALRLSSRKDMPVGSLNNTGYFNVKFRGQNLKCHRIVYSLFNELEQRYSIDHINGVRTDNRVSNLRKVEGSVNARNAKAHKDNSTGVTGVKLTSNGNNNYYSTAYYRNLAGKEVIKHFSHLKLGKEVAFKLACEFREKMIQEMNLQGAGYTERHGKVSQ